MKIERAGWLVLALSLACATDDPTSRSVGELSEVTSFGSNPGGLRMWLHSPPGAPPNAPVVVVLHGCTQSAADMERTGWSALADAHGFYAIYPQQTSSNNGAQCFRWYDPTQVRRGSGEVASIASMVAHVRSRFGTDPSRVFVAGFSAGGGLAPAALAAYPDVFSAGATNAGLPVGCATGVSDAFTCQNGNVDRTPSDWAARARAVGPSGYAGPWPRLAVWQGSADYTVRPKNAEELVEQWTVLHGIDLTADETGGLAALTFERHISGGAVLVERWTAPGMGHAVAIHPASGCGAIGAYVTDVGVCAAREQARFFGLLDDAPPADAGLPDDAGPSLPDAGPVVPDAGVDAGLVVVDAGPTLPDAGPVVVDAGPTLPDAGPVVLDAGPSIPDGGATADAAPGDAGAPTTCVQHTSSNYAHERAGRGARCGSFRSYVCAVGSGERLGLWNTFATSTLREEPSGFFAIGTCD